ncbi:meiosis arrest female 1-like isoform X1 [Brachionus plicatilis]|uniref:Meiosis arrest female 1-like isoform X1 n=1 Tax=Brachionus plicatilis TaxID=10195 RepID=A0A3M7T0I5_BRAPC|nr:meiosis arrest female 1-like isoform X1 [Brachionus plicatilis]
MNHGESPHSWIVDNLKSLIRPSDDNLSDCTLTSSPEMVRTLDNQLNPNARAFSPEEIHLKPSGCKLTSSNSSSSIGSLSYLDEDSGNFSKANRSTSGSNLLNIPSQSFINTSDFIDYDYSSLHDMSTELYPPFLALPSCTAQLSVPNLLKSRLSSTSTPSNYPKFQPRDQDPANSSVHDFHKYKAKNFKFPNAKIQKSSSTLFNNLKPMQVQHSTSYDNIGAFSAAPPWASTQLTPSNKEQITLHVKNLDYKISMDEWRRILMENFRKHCKDIISVNVVTNSDKSLLGIVKLGCKDDARLAISSLHHKKIGYKRLNVTIAFSPSSSSPKSKIVALLKSMDSNEMLLPRFIELYEQRYNQTITVSELFKLKDIVYITQSKDGNGRIIKLSCKNYHNNLENEMQELLHQPYCSLHRQSNQMDVTFLPNVVVSLRTFKSAVHKLLNDHGGQMPLLSFLDCYKCCILNQGSEIRIDSDNGVPLEHLITCAQDVQIQFNEGFYKQLKWENDKSRGGFSQKVSKKIDFSETVDEDCEDTQRKLNQFNHETIELFKGVPRCIILLSKFNNEYHKKYGRQCRVADYGFTKLYELLESIPHIVQIVDAEFEKKLTLTHRVQVKRFSNDLLKVLKTHKQMFADEFPFMFEKHFGKAFDIRDYGVCFLEDMLAELPDSIITRKEIDQRTFIQIPKIVQDDHEIMCISRLKVDIIDMLKPRPRFSIQFNKFIPNYHHHFGRQCKLSHYGFSKLVDLLESMVDAVRITSKDGIQFVQLQPDIQIDLICQNLVKLIEESNLKIRANLIKLEELFTAKFGSVHYQDLNCANFGGLLALLPLEAHLIQLEYNGLDMVLSVEPMNERDCRRVCKLLMNKLMDDLEEFVVKFMTEIKCCSFGQLWEFLMKQYDLSGKVVNRRQLNYVVKMMGDYFNQMDDGKVLAMNSLITGLSEFYYFAKQIRNLFKLNNLLDISLNDLENLYNQTYGNKTGLPIKRFGYVDAQLLLSQGLCLIVSIKKYQNDKRVCLNREFWPKTFFDSSSLSESFNSSCFSPPQK